MSETKKKKVFKSAYSGDHEVIGQDLTRIEEPILSEVVEYDYIDDVDDEGNPIRVAKEVIIIKEVGKRNIQEEINAAAIGTTIYEILARTEGDLPPLANSQFGNVADAPKDILEAHALSGDVDKALESLKGVYSSIDDLLADTSNNKLKAYIDAQVQAQLKEVKDESK